MISSFFQKFVSCCSTEKDKGNIPIIQSKKNINIILDKEKEKDHIQFVKEDFLKRRKSRNSSVNLNASAEKSLSFVSFSNIKVNERKESLNQNFDTEVLSTVELKLIGEIFWNKQLYIDRIGLKIGNRSKKNGITIFGLGETEDSNGNNVIDFILNIPGGKIPYQNNSKTNPLFSIEYDNNEDYFILNIINKELKIFHYIDYEFLIHNGSYLEFVIGKIVLYIKAPKDENDNYFNIEAEGVNYNFNKFEDCPITIGRSNCKINIKNNSISKNHAVIKYIEEKDCLFIKDLDSTNGTYFILGEKCTSFKILRDMDFKILEYKFSIKTIE